MLYKTKYIEKSLAKAFFVCLFVCLNCNLSSTIGFRLESDMPSIPLVCSYIQCANSWLTTTNEYKKKNALNFVWHHGKGNLIFSLFTKSGFKLRSQQTFSNFNSIFCVSQVCNPAQDDWLGTSARCKLFNQLKISLSSYFTLCITLKYQVTINKTVKTKKQYVLNIILKLKTWNFEFIVYYTVKIKKKYKQ